MSDQPQQTSEQTLEDRLGFVRYFLRLYPLVIYEDAIEYAKYMMQLYPRELLPDYVEILANGNPDLLEEVIKTAIDDLRSEEVIE